jgi:DNA-binding CsgD family transcriptional regulator
MMAIRAERMPPVPFDAGRHDGGRRGECAMPKTSSPPLRPRPHLVETPTPDVNDLLRDLIAAARVRGEPTRDPDGRRVLLELELNGVSCRLVEVAVPDEGRPALSPREQEIVRMVAKGYGNKTIARVLDISCWTVGTYLRRIFAKLNVGTRAAMVAKAHRLSFPNG